MFECYDDYMKDDVEVDEICLLGVEVNLHLV